MKKSKIAMQYYGTMTWRHVATWRGWLLLMVGFLLPLSVLADQVTVADANGNELRYTFDADGPATFTRIDNYSPDADKAGHIIIADRVTDANGVGHDVLYVSGSVSNRSNVVSIVFGQNIIATGGADGTGSSAFSGCSKLVSVTLNKNLEILGHYTFLNCYALASLNLGDCTKLTTIMASAVEDCDYLRELTIPASVTTIEQNAFYGIDSLRTVTFAAGSQLATLGEGVFSYCYKLQRINLEAATQLKTINNRVFYDCYDLQAITIPASVEEIGSSVLSYCRSIETLTFNAATVPGDFFRDSQKLTTINIGAGVKNIGYAAFYGNRHLRKLNISSSVSGLTIGEYAFSECDSIPEIALPAGVVALGRYAFCYNNCMTTFTFAEGSPITNIPEQCFYYCPSLEKLTLPDAVQTVENGAFGYCRALTEITFGTALTTLPNDWYLFYSCNNLQKVTLPGVNYPFSSEIWIPETAVYYVHPDLLTTYRTNDCTKNRRAVAIGQPMDIAVTTTAGSQLQSQIESQCDPNNVLSLKVTGLINGTDIDYIHSTLPNLQHLDLSAAQIVEGGDSYHRWNVSAGGNATIYSSYYVYNTDNNVVGNYMFDNMPMLKSIQLPRGVTAIGEYAFYGNRLLTTVGLGDAITAIGRNAFCYSGITEVNVPAGVTRLEAETFYDCNQLQKVALPDGITYIGVSCFSECDLLEDVNIPAQIETIDEYAFYNNVNRTTTIVLPATLKTIGSRAFMYNKVVKRISFSEGLETIGNSAFSNCNAVESLTLPESVTKIGDNAFEGCDSITEFRFPQNVKEVPYAVLYHCDNLQKVVLAEGTTRLEHYAFQYCPKLSDINISTMNTLTFTGRCVFENTAFTTITLPNSITEMDYSTFINCKQLTSVNVPTGIDYVPYDYCENCPELLSVTMHDGIHVVRHNAFYGCHKLRSIELNDQITDIEYNAFRYCDSLRLAKLPSALTFIGDAAFYQTKSMTGNIEIPVGVKQIDNSAFNRSGISGVIIPEGITNWGTSLFGYCDSLSNVQLPKDIKRITNYMFEYCPSLRHIQIPDSVKEVGYAAFNRSGLETITLPDSLRTIEDYAFASTQLQEFRVPDGLIGDPGSYTWEYCRRLKTVCLGRNQDYTQLTSFTCLSGCDSLQLLRIYAGAPPQCNQWYMGYRTNCVLEVPEDAVELFRAADVWKDFKEIRGFFQGDVLNDLDYAVLKKLYRELDGANWKNPWDLTNNHRSMGKWQGVLTVGDYITEIDLTGQGLKGELCDSLFLLSRIEKLNLSDNHVRADLTTLLANREANTTLTEVNMQGNELYGDIYPFASKLPNVTKLDLSYNRLTEVSQPISNEKLSNNNFARGFQFVSFQTKQVVNGAPVTDITPGIPAAMELNTVQTYRHEYGDYGYKSNDLYRHYLNKNGEWTTSDWELTRNSDDLWVVNTSYDSRVLRVQKGVPVMYTTGEPWWSHLSFIVRFDWTDGDVNADQTIDVTDLQSVVYYALNDGKPDGQIFNFTTADTNNDDKVNVSDIVGSVDYVLASADNSSILQSFNSSILQSFNSSILESVQLPYYNRAPASQQNLLTMDGNNVVLTHPDAVAALQLTVTGVALGQFSVSEALKSRFSVAMRQVSGGVRIVLYSVEGHVLKPGVHQLLSGLPVGATVTDVRLADSEARHLDVLNEGNMTSSILQFFNPSILQFFTRPEAAVYNLNGRRMGPWDSLPEGIYVIRVNGRQYKVKK